MVIIRGKFEVTELMAGCVGFVVVCLAGINVLPLKYAPDFPAILFVLPSVIVMHHVRVVKFPPIQQLWRLLLELAFIYIATQVLIAFVWEPVHAILDVIRDPMVDSTLGRTGMKYFPGPTLFLRQDASYFAQLVLFVMVTMKTLRRTRTLEYMLPERRFYQYLENHQATNEDF